MVRKDCVYRSTFSESNPFWELWFEHQDRVRSCCLKWLNGNQAQVEDALALTVEKALNYYLRRGNEIINLSSWLFKVAYNICIDMHREHRKNYSLCAQIFEDPSQQFFTESETEELEDQIERQDKIESIYEALRGMKIDFRLAIQFRVMNEMEYSDIAMILDTTPDNIRKRVQLARQKLRLMDV